jgi:hypothetical protein
MSDVMKLRLAQAIDSVRVHVISTRKAHRTTLTEAQDNTLYQVECLLNSLQTEIEDAA